ncbi:DNA polymerase III subunit gamma/tau [Waterburya agarophytonicola K14]|uniref:DNA polymerase III subunit gamma/tau n=1 Tax=Waterburya agarophytonicola KI4 TaxID=2874699 RepID=A0A964BUJ0_9CYAN|nr:DNA polymerase III subunit gamma/tau [Waterburya agarophytonicola]MCC0178942.1 DNA polymerase III subunit gamma/tau [Waterburya agarophytonicola KI4]
MPYEPIHHKYRPQTFKDLVGQETIALTLSNALKQEKIAPAYLFTGPRGTGKTSSARILAKSLNCLASDRPTPEPCGICEACLAIAKGSALDVMEIDAASNTGVDNIREIIERSRFAPVQCRYKIYAIDECHMLSTAAFNALLKTLEEPPPQVVFILATTDPQRVLSTIISRCQRFDYRRIPLPEMVSHLEYIARSENIAIANDALTLIAQIANGGLRDAESLLDQLSLLPDTISVEKVWDLVGAVPEQDLLKLLHVINQDNSLGVLEQCRSLLDRGREPIVVLQNLASFYLNLLIAKTAPQCPDLVAVTETCWQQLCEEAASWDTSLILRGQQHLKEAENQLKRTTQPRLWLEVTLLGLLPQAHQTIVSQAEPVISKIATVSASINIPVIEPQAPQNNIAPAEDTKVIAKVGEQPQKLPEKLASVPPSIAEPKFSSVPPKVPPTTPETFPSNPSPESSPATVSNVDIQGIWNRVVDSVPSRMTQTLLTQHCHLVSFDGSSAIVGISSATLQKLNQNKVPNIEQAFAKVVQHKVKVQLEVPAKNNNSKKNSEPVNNPPQQPIRTPRNDVQQDFAQSPDNSNYYVEPVEPVKPNIVQKDRVIKPQSDNFSDLNSAVLDSSVFNQNVRPFSQNSTSATTASVQNSLQNNISLIPSPEAIEVDLDSDYEDDDLQKAIASLTQSFEGELVKMERDGDELLELIETAEIETSKTIPILDRPDIEDYEDDW